MSPDNYHALTRSERDHLLAIASCDAGNPTGKQIQRRVGRLRGGQVPTDSTTYSTLRQLHEWGLVSKADGDDARKTYYDVTTDGHALLSQAVELFPA